MSFCVIGPHPRQLLSNNDDIMYRHLSVGKIDTKDRRVRGVATFGKLKIGDFPGLCVASPILCWTNTWDSPTNIMCVYGYSHNSSYLFFSFFLPSFKSHVTQFVVWNFWLNMTIPCIYCPAVKFKWDLELTSISFPLSKLKTFISG